MDCVYQQAGRTGSWARAVVDYSAASDSELTITKGEVVQIVGCSGSMFLVSRQMSSEQSMAGNVEGLVPCHILTQKDVGDNGIRYLWQPAGCSL